MYKAIAVVFAVFVFATGCDNKILDTDDPNKQTHAGTGNQKVTWEDNVNYLTISIEYSGDNSQVRVSCDFVKSQDVSLTGVSPGYKISYPVIEQGKSRGRLTDFDVSQYDYMKIEVDPKSEADKVAWEVTTK